MSVIFLEGDGEQLRIEDPWHRLTLLLTSPSALFKKKIIQTSGSVQDKEGGLIKVFTPNFNTFHLTPGCMRKTTASFRSS